MKAENNKENFTQIPNELMEILMDKELTKNEARILMYIARKTFGYHSKTAKISRREFNEKLTISLRHITEIQDRLQEIGLIKLVNKGSSKLNSSEWEIDFADAKNKLAKLSKIDRRSIDWKMPTGNPRVPRYPKVTGYPPTATQLDTRSGTQHEALNKRNKYNNKENSFSKKENSSPLGISRDVENQLRDFAENFSEQKMKAEGKSYGR